MAESSNIRVCVRFRPPNEREDKIGKSKTQITIQHGTHLEIRGGGFQTNKFDFDRVFEMHCEQITLRDVLQGYNGTIFAYGQTGAGKTFTMMGDLESEAVMGVIPRAIRHVFNHIREDLDNEYAVKCSYLEIYNETIQDLLDPTQTKKNLKVHESPARGIYVSDLTEEYVESEEELYVLINIGDSNRKVAATGMNKVSSRSHTVFIIELNQKTQDGSTKTGKLNLVDLAGSERVAKTKAAGERIEEAKKINQSLSALGMCINSLVENKPHIPYRDSKLTRILQESLGGNTKTTLVCACSPHDNNMDETISTLKFGARAKTIKNRVTVNAVKSAAELQKLVDKLKAELESLKAYCRGLEQQVEWMKRPDYQPGMPMPEAILKQLSGNVVDDDDDDDDSKVGEPAHDIEDSEEPSDYEQKPNNPLLQPNKIHAPKSLAEAEFELENVRASARSQITNLNDDLEDMKDKDKENHKELQEMQEIVDSFETERIEYEQEFEDKLSVYNTEKEKMLYERDQLEMELENVMVDCEEAKIARDEFQSECRELKKIVESGGASSEEVNRLQAEQDVLFEELASSEETVAKLQEEIEEFEAQVEKLNAAIEENKEDVRVARGERDDLYEYITQVESDLQSEQVKRVEAEGQQKLLKQKIEQMMKEHEGSMKAMTVLEQNLRAQIAEREELLTELESDQNRAVAELQDASEKEEELLDAIETLENEVEAKDAELDRLKSQLRRAAIAAVDREDGDELSADLESLLDEHAEDVKELRDSFSKREQKLKQDIASARQEREQIRTKMESEVTTLRSEKDRAVRDLVEHQERVKELNTRVELLQKEKSSAQEDVVRTQTALDKVNIELNLMKTRFEQEQQKAAAAVQDSERLDRDIEELREENTKLRKTSEEIAEKERETHEKRKQAMEARFKSETEELRTKLVNAEEERNALEKEVQKEKDSAIDAVRKYNSTSRRFEMQEQRIDQLQQSLEESRQECTKVKRVEERARIQNKELKEKAQLNDQKVKDMEELTTHVARRPRMWRPVQRSSILEAFAKKEDFGQHLLRSTDSKFLKEAAEEDARANAMRASEP